MSSSQLRKFKKINEIYGQDSEELGLSPRDKRYLGVQGRKRISRKGERDGNMSALVPGGSKMGSRSGSRKKGSKNRSKGRKGESVEDARMRRFNDLNLNRPRGEEGEYDKLKRKLQKFRQRKDLSFWMDYDSPYAEYLPHRFREWVPVTKSGLTLDNNNQRQNADGRAHELSRIYSRGLSPGENLDDNQSRNEGKKSGFNTGSKSRPKSNASMGIESIGNLSSNKKSREMTSNKKSSPRNRRPPAHIGVYNNFLGADDQARTREHRESNDALNEGTARTKNEFEIGALYDYDENINSSNQDPMNYEKAEDDEEIDFRPVKFNQLFNE